MRGYIETIDLSEYFIQLHCQFPAIDEILRAIARLFELHPGKAKIEFTAYDKHEGVKLIRLLAEMPQEPDVQILARGILSQINA